MLGVKADDVGRQYVDGKIRRELQNVLAGPPRLAGPRLRAGLAMSFHRVSTHMAPIEWIAAHDALLQITSSRRASIFRFPCKAARGLSASSQNCATEAPQSRHELAGSTWSNPAMTSRVFQWCRKRRRKCFGFSTSGRRPMTRSRSRSRRNRRNDNRGNHHHSHGNHGNRRSDSPTPSAEHRRCRRLLCRTDGR
jgi:hypothetical protein